MFTEVHLLYRVTTLSVLIDVLCFVSVIACKEKAQFLLKFAGLQRITDKTCEVQEQIATHFLVHKNRPFL